MKLIFILCLALAWTGNAGANTYWVNPSGVNAPTCNNSSSDPGPGGSSRTIAQGVQCLQSAGGGHTLNIKSGTYNERIDGEYNPGLLPPNGLGDTQRTTFRAIDGIGTVIIKPSDHSSHSLLGFPNPANAGDPAIYHWFLFEGIVYDGFNIDAGVSGPGNISSANVVYLSGLVDNITFKDSSVINGGFWTNDGSNHNGVIGMVITGPSHVRIQGTCSGGTCTCKFWDNGRQIGDPAANQGNAASAYHVYHTGGNDVIVDGCHFARSGGYGWHAFTGGHPENINDLIIRNSIFEQSGITAQDSQVTAQLMCTGDRCAIYNNIVFGGFSAGIAIGNVSGVSTKPKIYNNTVYGHRGFGIQVESGPIVQNNIAYNNGLCQTHSDACNGTVDIGAFDGAGATVSNNLCGTFFNNTGSSSGWCPVTSNPRFLSAVNNNFRLCEGSDVPAGFGCTVASPAIDAGITLTSPSGINVDFAGTTRPRGTAWDMGAYEASGAAPGPTCPTKQMLVAQYSFDGVATDSSGNKNNATLGSAVTYVAGKYNQGVSFPGGSTIAAAGITVPHSASLFMCDFTVSMWVQLASPLTTFAALATTQYDTSEGWILYAGSSGYPSSGPVPGAPIGGPTTGVFAVYGTPLTTAMTYITLTYDRNLVKLWVNGTVVSQANTTVVLSDWSGNLCIGCSPYGEYLPAGSIIDEVQIWNYARTSAQINNDMITSINPLPPPPARNFRIGSTTQQIGPGITKKIGP